MNAVTPITPAIDTADTRAEALLALLATVPALTDMPTSLNHARSLAAKVKMYRGWATGKGMLGENGIAPAVRACVSGARFHGFDWRDRYALQDMRDTASRTLTQPTVISCERIGL